MTLLEGHDIVVLSCLCWDDHWGTPQQLISRLAQYNRIFYIDPAISPLSFLSGVRDRPFLWRQAKRWFQGWRLVAPNVAVATPPPVLPLRYDQRTSTINAALVRRWLRHSLQDLGLQKPIFWSFQPAMPGVDTAVQPDCTIYHCLDSYSAVPAWWNAKDDVDRREAECCQSADLVLSTGQALAERWRQCNQRTYFVPNGADTALFRTALDPETPVPLEMARMRGKVVGFYGVLDFRLDVELLTYLARRQPDWDIVLIGLVKGGVNLAPLRALPNVHFLGWQDPARLPGYVKAMDVCMIPYGLNEFGQHMFPLKLFEYMAAGKPIVASALPELCNYAGEQMQVASSREEFRLAVAGALSTDHGDRASAWSDAAQAHSWDHRIEQISAIVQATLQPVPCTLLA